MLINFPIHLSGSLLVLLLVLFSCPLAYEVRAQRNMDRLTLGDGHVVFGDLKVEGENSGTFQVSLQAGLSVVSQQTLGANGRYRFLGVPNGEYVIVVEFENQIITRMPIRLADPRKNDFRFDILLEQRAISAGKSRTAAVVSYKRSVENQNLFDKAFSAADKKQLGQAASFLQQALANDPQDFVAWTELGTIFFKQDKFSEGEKAYLKALEAKPAFVLALLNLGKLRLAQKNYEGAAEVLTQAATADPASANAQHYLGEAYLGLKKGSKALGPLAEALRLDPLGKAEIHLRLAALYNGAQMKDKAAAEYEQFLSKRPDHPEKKKLQQYIAENKKP